MQELGCAVAVLGLAVLTPIGILKLAAMLQLNRMLSAFLAGAALGGCMFGLGELAFFQSMTCFAAGLLFQVHTAVFSGALALVSSRAAGGPDSEWIARVAHWQWAFWMVFYGTLAVAMRLAWSLGKPVAERASRAGVA